MSGKKKTRGQVDGDLFVCGGFASDAKSVGFVGSGVPEYMAKSNATLFFFLLPSRLHCKRAPRALCYRLRDSARAVQPP